MDNLIRMVYVSRTNNPISDERGGVPKDVGRILMQSRKSNPRREIGGVLYFRDDIFFQCLEGPQSEVDALYKKIANDPRHRDVTTILARHVDTRMFADWSMKYVALDHRIDQLLQKYKFSSFDPYRFDEKIIEEMLGLFVSADDVTSQDRRGASETSPRTGFLGRLFRRRAA